MLSLKKAINPPPMNTSRPKMMIARRVSPNSRMPFNTNYCSRTKCRSNATMRMLALRPRSGFTIGQDVEKHRALGDDSGARPHSLEYLVVARILQSDLDRSLREVMTIGCEPYGHAAVALSNDSLHRDRHAVDRGTGDDDERSEHPGQKLVLRVIDLGAYQPPMQLGIDGCTDGGNFSVEYSPRKRHDGYVHVLPFADPGHVALSDAGIHPNAGNVRD